MKKNRKIITIDESLCDGCGNCVVGCAEGALAVIDGKARLVSESFCDGLGACIGHCPTGALKIVEADAEDFDSAAAAEHMDAKPAAPAHACPGSQVADLAAASACAAANVPAELPAGTSRLGHWPIQLRLAPPDAPFLRNARLLLTADCAPPALPNFNARFLPGRVLLLACPKFDDVQAHVDKLAAILRANAVRDITILRMEVPCCAGLEALARRALLAAGVAIPVKTVVVARDGRIPDRAPKLTPLPGREGSPRTGHARM